MYSGGDIEIILEQLLVSLNGICYLCICLTTGRIGNVAVGFNAIEELGTVTSISQLRQLGRHRDVIAGVEAGLTLTPAWATPSSTSEAAEAGVVPDEVQALLLADGCEKYRTFWYFRGREVKLLIDSTMLIRAELGGAKKLKERKALTFKRRGVSF